jgi:hypothetical protein
MHKLLVAVSAGAILAASTMMALAEDVSGVITVIDPTAGTVMLDTGQVFLLPDDIDAASLSVGQPVTVTYEEGEGGTMNATSIAPAG